MTDTYQIWRAELTGKEPERMNVDPQDGFWRLDGARTKPSYPVAIWHPATGTKAIVRIGRRDIEEDSDEWFEFGQNGWMHCVAVEKTAYDEARATGRWADNKPARQMDEAEKLGIDVSTGGNNPPLNDAIGDQIAAAVESAQKITAVTNADEARKANEMAERLAGLFKIGDAERDKEKRPHDEASKAVQAKWLPIITPASDERTRVLKLAKDWIKAEEARLAREAQAERQRQQAAIDKENERIRLENEKAKGEAPAGAEVELQPELAPAVVETPKVQATSTYGRATGLRTVKKGKITDIVKLLTALSTHKEMVEFAQTLANRAAKAGIPLDGMEIEEVRE